jgi:hypothetical protein
MAKPLGEKSVLIRDAIKAHPGMSNIELAKLLSESPARQQDKIEVSASDVSAQKQALKKLEEGSVAPASRNGEPAQPPAKAKAPPPVPQVEQPPARPASTLDLIDRVFELSKECGGLEQLKHLVDRLMQAKER